MILYFSGTGNSEYIAKRIAKTLDKPSMNLFDRIKEHNDTDLTSSHDWIIVVPTYAWRIPRIVEDWLKKTNLKGNQNIYFVMTCGGSNGNADHYLKKLCQEKQMHYQGCYSIVMPENYIAIFAAPSKQKSLEIIDKAEKEIDTMMHYLKKQMPFPQPQLNAKDRLSSGIVNILYYPLIVHAKRFYATDECISCGKCVKECPLNNIHLEQGKPKWGNSCTHCMACICKCPKEAIEYGKHTIGKNRYTCPK